MRITGGTHRSRALLAPRGTATRPTSDRVREALFGILTSAAMVDGARVLDLYSGTGALGLEALSRGAAHATLVESSREAIAVITTNVEALGFAPRVRIVPADVDRASRRLSSEMERFDLVFADPPWSLVDSGEAPRALVALAGSGLLAEGAWVILEHSCRTPSPDATPLECLQTRKYGDTALTFYKIGILASPRQDVDAGSPSDRASPR